MKLILFVILGMTSPLFAAEFPKVFSGVDTDSGVPDMQAVNGFDFGEKIATHAETLAYARRLADASPRVSLIEHGGSWEGRTMALLFVSSAENIQNLSDYQKRWQKLADPRMLDKDALDEHINGLPTLVWLLQSVHGNEISGTDSGILLAWRMASARNHAEIDEILNNSVIMIELFQNPDGRDRFIVHARTHRAPGWGDGDPQAAERNEAWPSGRFNHYLFDMNRDWFAQTQVETQAKVRTLLEWRPHVSVDLHEMGSESTFFAANPSPPANPLLPQSMLERYMAVGREIGKKMDTHGIPYFHSEVFDSFYPGYGESWPSLQGTIGVLFEQGSARGLVYHRTDGTVLTHRHAVESQALGSYAVAKYAAQNRDSVLRFFHQMRQEPLSWTRDNQAVLLPGSDPLRMQRLGDMLVKQGIEVSYTKDDVEISVRKRFDGEDEKETIPSGSMLVRFDQPAGRLAKTLLIDHLDMDADFIARQEERRRNRDYLEIYDITSWSLPAIFGVPVRYPRGAGLKASDITKPPSNRQVINPDAKLAYLIPTNLATSQIVADLLRQDVKLYYLTEPAKHAGVTFPHGSLVVHRRGNPDNLVDRLKAVTEKFDTTLVGVDTYWLEEGPGLGSDLINHIPKPRLAMLWDSPTNPMSAGWARYQIEQRFNYPITALKTERVAGYDLRKYDVIIMPEGYGWSRALGPGGVSKLKDWINAGGVLISLAASTNWLMGDDVGLLPTVSESRGGTVTEPPTKDYPEKPEEDPFDMILPLQESPQYINGALLNVNFDPEHWVSYGMPERQAVLVNSNRILRPLRLNRGENPGRFTGLENLRAAGYIDGETLAQIAHKPFLMVRSQGYGVVIAFTEDPNYRAFTEGLLPLFGNAVFLGSANASR